MKSNFNIFELERTFSREDGWVITNYSKNFVVITNKNKFFIAEIFRSSNNYYELITASPIYFQRITINNFNAAEKWIKVTIKKL